MREDTGKKQEKRLLSLAYRATPEAKERLERLVDLVSDGLGARVSRSQAIEVAVREAVERRAAAQDA